MADEPKVKGFQVETNAPPVGPSVLRLRGFMVEIPQIASDINLQEITVGKVIIGVADGAPTLPREKGSMIVEQPIPKLWRSIDSSGAWEDLG